MLLMRGIMKSFSGVTALDNIHFEVKPGEIHALLGANGAGKSTLMKILTGAYAFDQGELLLDGKTLTVRNPQDAIQSGIQCVYQEVDTVLFPELTVTENIMLDRFTNGGVTWVNWRALEKEASRILASVGLFTPVGRKVSELSLSEKQLILIARAVAQQAKIVVFDEPTAPLSLSEAERLFHLMRKLKDEGVACIFITHRLPEVFAVCDRITVMRDGRVISTRNAADTSIPAVIADMLGRTFGEEFPKRSVPIGGVLLEAQGLRRGTRVRGVSLAVRAGEIVGIAGLVGAGKSELSRLLFGADSPDGGTIRLRGKTLRLKQPHDAVKHGIVLVPEERRKEGILAYESVGANLTLPTLSRHSVLGFVRRSRERLTANALVARLGVKTPGLNQLVARLSGGNQQKVAVGKWLPTEANVFLFDEPTKGVDIGAKQDMFRLIGDLAAEGKGVIYFSSEIQEITGIADRILVMCDGRIVKELSREEATQNTILYYASGGGEEK
ncbi:ABC transporter [Paenibacillus swuensis]|uniref:ABC transporter n=1 Tax=Paenibacillus swuensis TaxID=1178515 RepID=A0A172TLC6_9BACL|nr:sugar ABC transporter ATP-binding protein [Paenibacillus swuensis]ANE47838.1 ABC transporter [Paenibacillus swuensis]